MGHYLQRRMHVEAGRAADYCLPFLCDNHRFDILMDRSRSTHASFILASSQHRKVARHRKQRQDTNLSHLQGCPQAKERALALRQLRCLAEDDSRLLHVAPPQLKPSAPDPHLPDRTHRKGGTAQEQTENQSGARHLACRTRK